MIAEPPLKAGATKATVADPSPAATPLILGAPGIVDGVTLFEAADGALLPAAFVAITEQVTETPFERLPTVMGEVGPVLLCAPQVAV